MKKVLIANRGEIAVRIIRGCADYGLASVAVYADPDADAVHVRLADEAYGLVGDRPADTYLSIPKLLEIAVRSGADAVHPGYGFLSESAEFARAVEAAGLTWIGPSPEAIDLLGDKVAARKIAERVGAPLVSGTSDPVADAGEVVAFAEEHGLPIAIKAAFGGGGRGLKVAWRLDEVAELFDSAVREAVTAFGRGECFVEQFLDRPRHIEAQVVADAHGNVVVVGTRDCSLQRRNQKLVEEAPAPFLTDGQRERIHSASRDICAAAGYRGAGTVEFLLSADGTISFLEVNTRLQVEHPVTEETTGVDLVIEQFRIAEGLPLSITETPAPTGHSFEFRLNAEDAGRGFLPTPGTILRFSPPAGPGVRVDSGVESGSIVPGTFDSMMAKLIVTGATREQAILRARRALAECTIEGVASVLPFHRAVMAHDDFVSPDRFGVHTRWIETEGVAQIPLSPRSEPLPGEALSRTFVEVDGRRMCLGLPAALLTGLAAVAGSGSGTAGGVGDAVADAGGAVPSSASAPDDPAVCVAPITGTLLAWQVAAGDTVVVGDVLAIMEAMKMETQVLAHRAGTVTTLVETGVFVPAGTALLRVEREGRAG
ncbi:biotin carboxylase N-terminal domain-containing protein [Klugiella xanthotipulae]|uniref:biotin carboxylase n=1 Tax=Klugiella xanthotipulae TaxID=244735 RepID=A0A543HH61_9MICO|nr:biotin carboxylase N-terminal domain-containing protein [Klugiella xanthotipulae]TQM57629.1 acetyl-CoA/propionyl-CoA carboxylase biotin carboxyl carrier protein [Klugiella xanthotipulae]